MIPNDANVVAYIVGITLDESIYSSKGKNLVPLLEGAIN